jgi:hypothetical protein
VPPCEDGSTADDILENLDLAAVGAGEPASGLGMRDEKPDGPGLILSRFAFACDCGAGRVMKPVELSAWAFALAFSFFLDFFSALLFDKGWESKNSAAWGTAL